MKIAVEDYEPTRWLIISFLTVLSIAQNSALKWTLIAVILFGCAFLVCSRYWEIILPAKAANDSNKVITTILLLVGTFVFLSIAMW